jgi:hypothetical protein
MVTTANENLKAKIPKPTQELEQQLEDLKARLKAAFKAVTLVTESRKKEIRLGTTDARRFANLTKESLFIYTTRP